MSKSFHSLFSDIASMSDEELHERIKEIRGRKYIERPAAAARAKRAAQPETTRKVTAAANLLKSLTPEQIAELLNVDSTED